MPTYTWLQSGHSYAGALNIAPLGSIQFFIPANGVIKRFQVVNASIAAELTGSGYNTIGAAIFQEQVVFQNYLGVDRTIYQSERRVPVEATALYDVLTAQRIYTAYYGAGDNESGFNQRCSYGKRTDPLGKFISFHPGIFWGPSGGLAPDGVLSYTFRVLYATYD